MNWTSFTTSVRTSVVVAGIVIGYSGYASAVTYDFKIVGGNRIYDVGRFICLDVAQSSASKVTFTLWSQIPQPVASIEILKFDTGSHTNMFSDISVVLQSQGGTIKKMPPSDAYFGSHAYLPRFTADYVFRKEGTSLYHPGGISKGELIVLSATLGAGKTYTDVINALNQGSSVAAETSGLRMGIIVYHLKGKRRDPRVTEGDDAGFVINSLASHCQQR